MVEDNQPDASQIARILENGELIQLDFATDGRHALEQLEATTYDCIIADYMLPDMEGSDLLANIQSGQRQPATPLIVYSAKDFSKTEKQN